MGNKGRYIPTGMTALFEAMNNAEYAEKSLDENVDVVMGLTESVSYLDAVAAGLMSDDVVRNDMDRDFEFASDSDKELFNKIDSILPDEDDVDDIISEQLDATLESYISNNDGTKDLYECDY